MLLVALPNGRSFAVDAPAGASVDDLRAAVEKATGTPLGTQTLLDAAGAPAAPGSASLRVAGAALPPPPPPPPAGGAGGDVTVTVKPRLQKETWSMYWKETMATKTVVQDAFTATFSPACRVADVAAAAAARAGWAAPTDADRLPGFAAPWTAAYVRGHAVPLDATLAAAGVAAGGEVAIVRVVLKPEKWSVLPADGEAAAAEDDDDDASTSSDDEGDGAGAGGGLWCGI